MESIRDQKLEQDEQWQEHIHSLSRKVTEILCSGVKNVKIYILVECMDEYTFLISCNICSVQRIYSRIPLIRINWDDEPSE
jgi:hypothetical protein